MGKYSNAPKRLFIAFCGICFLDAKQSPESDGVTVGLTLRQLATLTYIDQLNQPESTWFNPYQPISTLSTGINRNPTESTQINPNQPESI